uniref:Tumor necrosis factor receptor superfamily member 6 n=1 Tax=Pelodiscus sinensis TaxID=13735 RepID=K7FD59_PELSI|nr:tumor necrosis factor receptor superfamily member 6 [Pelodiscus sinensis]|eukprot:XP_014428204.1 tumor necrosis factor receptor superfamily member 6 [Pelodiscus sinensis]
MCCKMCAPGSFKHADCTKTNKTAVCDPCTEGTYTEQDNALLECMRCRSCDTILGFEVEKHCTTTHNTKCRCAQHHFCNSSEPCGHCDPCSKCENDAIEKECTQTTDTICKRKGHFWWIYLVAGIIITSLAAIAVYCYKKKRQDFDLNKEMPCQDVHRPPICVEMEPLMHPDVDLSIHIPAIVEEMTLSQVKAFVRNREISETAIEQTLQDNLNDSVEQKIKLFHIWYQHHGMKGAYGSLISSLRELKMRAVADKIEKKLNVVTCSTQENGKWNVSTAE